MHCSEWVFPLNQQFRQQIAVTWTLSLNASPHMSVFNWFGSIYIKQCNCMLN